MKKFIMFFFVTLLFTTMFFQTGCSSDSTTDDIDQIVIGIDVTPPTDNDTLYTETSFTVEAQLTGLTLNYKEINFSLGDNTLDDESWDQAKLEAYAETHAVDAEIIQEISTVGLTPGNYDLVVEAVGTDLATDDVTFSIEFVKPDSTQPWIDIEILQPDTNEFAIGDIIEFDVRILGNQTMFKSFDVYFEVETEPFYSTTTYAQILNFNFETEDLPIGNYVIHCNVTDVDDIVKEKLYNFSLVEFIPTFDITDDAGVGYDLKSIIQTYDGGYVTVASDLLLGTRVVKYKYNKVTAQVDVQWQENITADIGIAESVCEDVEYSGGIVLAGWRDNGTDIDTWVRKISNEDGSLLWNKHYGYSGIDDGATVIKKSNDDGYILGGYSYNYYQANHIDGAYEEFMIPGPNSFGVDSIVYNWDTGYDIRLLKLYSNGNEVWGHNTVYGGHKLWHDITAHVVYYSNSTVPKYWWVKTMGDQYIKDIVATDEGEYQVTGWNNTRLYDGNTKKDMFYTLFDQFGNIVSSSSWGRMSADDKADICQNYRRFSDYWTDYFNVYRLNYSFKNSRSYGSYDVDEIGYGITNSHGAYLGKAVMVGETYEEDDLPAKSKLHDGWVVEFKVDADDDGVLWEYSFGDEKEDKAFGVDQTKDDGYIVTGYTTETDKSTWTYKLNTELLIVWSKQYDTTGDDWGIKSLQCRDGGFMIGGTANPGGGVRARLIKVNKLGEFNIK